MQVKLEKFKKSDFENYFQLVNNEKVMEMITKRTIGLKEAEIDFKKLVENNNLRPNFGNFKMLNAETNDFLGLAKLEIKEINSDEAELGYMVKPEYWGKGIGGTVGKKLIEIGKKQNSIKRIFAIIDPKNIPSRKILTNNGFKSKEFKDFNGLPGEILELKINKKSTSANRVDGSAIK